MLSKILQVILFVFLALGGASQGSYAACTSPDGGAGDLVYNYDHRLMQFCDGSRWVATSSYRMDGVPDEFTFVDTASAVMNALITSSTITPAGFGETIAVTISGDGAPQFRIDGGAWGTTGTIGKGQTIQLRATSASTEFTDRIITVTIGGVEGTWNLRTGGDTMPDAFDFTNVTGADPSTVTSSNIITISGINDTTPVSVTGDGSPQFSINSGAWTTSGNILDGQTLQVRLTSSASYTTAHNITVTVGGVSDTWGVTTRAIYPQIFTADVDPVTTLDVTGPGATVYGSPVRVTITNTGETASSALLSAVLSNTTNFEFYSGGGSLGDDCIGNTFLQHKVVR